MRTRQPDDSSRGFRKDIQGLRAIAVSLVVIFHLWPHSLTGGYAGVDVFFVISGYLITAHLLARPPRTAVDLGRFWARRIHRLLPAALTVLAVTAVATRLVAPSTHWASAGKEIIASALYVQNWTLASASVDYLADDQAPSPAQHYWSLSIEEQFYLVWPLLILTAFFVARRRRWDTTRVARYAIGAMVVVSLTVSVWATAGSPASAYFITPARMWELATGGMIATFGVLAANDRWRPYAAVIAWLGVAAIAVTGFTYTGATPFPGYTALLPVLGASAVIWAGSQHPWSPLAVLGFRPIQWIGAVSYSVYLWHWPLVVLVPFVSGGSLGVFDKSAILVSTLVLGGLSKVYIEDKFRLPRRGALLRHSYRAAVVGMAVVTVIAGSQVVESRYRTHVAKQDLARALENGGPCFGAGSLARGQKACPQNEESDLVPAVELAAHDKSDAYADGCWTNSPFTGRRTCTYGDGPVQVALVGNSHAGHWLPALQILADENDWTITTYLVSRCAVTDAPQEFKTEEMSQNCYDYGQWVREETSGNDFDLVITSERQSVPVLGASLSTRKAKAIDGYESYLRDWAAGGTNILVIKDPTFPGIHVPDCLAEHSDDPSQCSAPTEDWVIDDHLVSAVEDVDLPGVTFVSYDDLVCGPARCYGAIGGVIAYFDTSHLTATYVKTMAPHMKEPILEALRRG